VTLERFLREEREGDRFRGEERQKTTRGVSAGLMVVVSMKVEGALGSLITGT
jgi:hypothetical protein